MSIQTTTASQKKNDTSQTKGHDLRAAVLRVLSECVCSYGCKYDATTAQNDAPNSPKATSVMEAGDQTQDASPEHYHNRKRIAEAYHRILICGHHVIRHKATQPKCNAQRPKDVSRYSPHLHGTPSLHICFVAQQAMGLILDVARYVMALG